MEINKGIDDALKNGKKIDRVTFNEVKSSIAVRKSTPGLESLSLKPEDADLIFRGVLGQIVKEISKESEVDPLGLMTQGMVIFTTLLGSGPYFLNENTRLRAKLFLMIVGASAKARKGTSWAQAMYIFSQFSSELNKVLCTGLSTAEGLIARLADPDDNGKDSKAPKKLVEKRCLVMEAEFAGLLQSQNKEGSKLSPVIRDAYDKDFLSIVTRHNPIKASGVHVCIVGHITKDELDNRLSTNDISNGFANRFLWLYTQRSKIIPNSKPIREEVITPLKTELRRLFYLAKNTSKMNFSEKALEEWHEVYTNLTKDEIGVFGSIVSRRDTIVLRLAMIYALLDGKSIIDLEHLKAAQILWNFSERSCAKIFGKSFGNDIMDEIYCNIQSRPEGIARTEIRDIFNRNKSQMKIQAALDRLVELGLVYSITEPTGGRVCERWFLKK